MPAGALIISWGASIPGREAKGLEVFGASLEFAERWTKEGLVTGHREYFAMGRDGGMQILEGEIENLQAIARQDDFLSQVVKAQAVVNDVRIEFYGGGSDDSVQELMGTYMNSMSELGYL